MRRIFRNDRVGWGGQTQPYFCLLFRPTFACHSGQILQRKMRAGIQFILHFWIAWLSFA